MRNPLDYTLAEIETLVRIGLLEGNSDYHFAALLHELKEYQRDAQNYVVKKEAQEVRERTQPAMQRHSGRCRRYEPIDEIPCVLVSE